MIFNQCVNVAPQRQPGKHKVKRAQGTQGLIKGLVVEQVQVAEFKKKVRVVRSGHKGCLWWAGVTKS